jgi:hypothetical protein
MSLMKNYNEALEKIYKHVGFVEDWVIYPIDDRTNFYWEIVNNNSVKLAETLETLNSDEDYYEDVIYTQRFYSKWIYRGEKYTMIFCDSCVDGMKWFRVFSNELEVK